jgi:hypothetical protein
VTFTSPNGGQVTGHAAVDVEFAGLLDQVHRETDGTRHNSGDASVTFVDAQLTIAFDAVMDIGESHEMTVTILADYGGGQSFIGVSGLHPSFSYPGLELTDIDCADYGTIDDGTNDDGQCSVRVSMVPDGPTGVYNVTAGYLLDIDGVQFDLSDTAILTFVDADITITQSVDKVGIGDTHTFTVTVIKDVGDGNGLVVPADGTHPDVTLVPNFGAVVTDKVDNCVSTGTVDGVCTVTFTSATAGQVTGSATVGINFDIDPSITVTRVSGSTTVTFVDGSLRWSKVNHLGELLGGATFEICRTHGVDETELDPQECQTVTDGLDGDLDDGELYVTGLRLGTWTIKETIPPPGYNGDFLRIEEVILAVGSINGVVGTPWINTTGAQIAPTQTTCYDFLYGLADDLKVVNYRRSKDDTINNVAPGVFFYYTQVVAPSNNFEIRIHQSSSFYPFIVQNEEQIRLFEGNCDLSTVQHTVGKDDDTGEAWVIVVNDAYEGQLFIVSVKYDTGSLVGYEIPLVDPVHYDFETELVYGNPQDPTHVIVDQDPDGLDLKKKGK